MATVFYDSIRKLLANAVSWGNQREQAGTLQEALNRVLSDAPYDLLTEIIAQKSATNGLTLSARERRQLTAHLQSSANETIYFRRWNWWTNRTVSTEITPEEAQRIDDKLTEFMETKLPALIEPIIEDLSVTIFATLNKGWNIESNAQAREIDGFRKRLYGRWGQAIEHLQMFLTISREFGEGLNASYRSHPDASRANLVEVLTRLHARACQVTEEIICLLCAGFADGAMARWRTLHEIAVVALFIKEHGELTAKRYVAHQVVESFRAAKDYQACCQRLGYEPMSESEIQQLKEAFDSVLQQYGSNFEGPYGWAANVLSPEYANFRRIENASGIDHFRAYYRMASHNVHANPKGVFFKLGLLKEANVLLAGASNAGLAEPGQNTVISLLQVSTALGAIDPTLDSLVILRILMKLEDEVSQAFYNAHSQLEQDSAS